MDLQTPLANAPIAATIAEALEAYSEWRQQVAISSRGRVVAGQRAINALLAAGVTVKGAMQEELCLAQDDAAELRRRRDRERHQEEAATAQSAGVAVVSF